MNHPFHKGSIDEEALMVMAEQDNNFEVEDEQTKAKPNLDTYKPHTSYPLELKRPRAKASEYDDHLL